MTFAHFGYTEGKNSIDQLIKNAECILQGAHVQSHNAEF